MNTNMAVVSALAPLKTELWHFV